MGWIFLLVIVWLWLRLEEEKGRDK